jgi:hypothetical protein
VTRSRNRVPSAFSKATKSSRSRDRVTKGVMAVGLVVGSRLPAYRTYMGRVLLAALNQKHLSLCLDHVNPAKHTPHTITEWSALETELVRVRDRGYALVSEELESGAAFHCSAGNNPVGPRGCSYEHGSTSIAGKRAGDGGPLSSRTEAVGAGAWAVTGGFRCRAIPLRRGTTSCAGSRQGNLSNSAEGAAGGSPKCSLRSSAWAILRSRMLPSAARSRRLPLMFALRMLAELTAKPDNSCSRS